MLVTYVSFHMKLTTCAAKPNEEKGFNYQTQKIYFQTFWFEENDFAIKVKLH